MNRDSSVLFVDDEEEVLEALARVLHNEPYNVLCAKSGAQAIQILGERKVQLVVSDFRMPAMSGAELLHTVAERWPETTRIILSGYADVSSVVTAINEGQIFKFLSKPWDNRELQSIIKSGIEKYWENYDLLALAESTAIENQALLDGLLLLDKQRAMLDTKLYESSQGCDVFRTAFENLLGPSLLFRNGELTAVNHSAFAVLNLPATDPAILNDEPFLSMIRNRIRALGLQRDVANSEFDIESREGNGLRVRLSMCTVASGEVIGLASLSTLRKITQIAGGGADMTGAV